jgi:hypothetical protein
LGKRKVISEEDIENMVLPSANDVLRIAIQMIGYDRFLVKCQDGKERLCLGFFNRINAETFSGGTGRIRLNG